MYLRPKSVKQKSAISCSASPQEVQRVTNNNLSDVKTGKKISKENFLDLFRRYCVRSLVRMINQI